MICSVRSHTAAIQGENIPLGRGLGTRCRVCIMLGIGACCMWSVCTALHCMYCLNCFVSLLCGDLQYTEPYGCNPGGDVPLVRSLGTHCRINIIVCICACCMCSVCTALHLFKRLCAIGRRVPPLRTQAGTLLRQVIIISHTLSGDPFRNGTLYWLMKFYCSLGSAYASPRFP